MFKNRLLVLLVAAATACGNEPAVPPQDDPAPLPIDEGTQQPDDGSLDPPPPPPADDEEDDGTDLPSRPDDEDEEPPPPPVPPTQPPPPGQPPTNPPPTNPTPPAACTNDDAYEPNDLQTEAKTLAANSQVSGCAKDEDWFVVDVGAGCTLTVTLTFTNDDGDLDLALFDADGLEVDNSAGVADEEVVTTTATAAGRYAAQVLPYGDAENAFTIRSAVNCTGTTNPPPAADACPDDPDADTAAAAMSIGASITGASCSGDQDWFKATIGAGCTVTATLTFTHADGDLDLVLDDATGARLDSSLSYTDAETVEATFAASGEARIGVLGYGAASNDYTLSVATECPEVLSCPADDDWEPNDDGYTAWSIFDGETLPGVVCSNDRDVWALQVEQDCLAVVELDFKNQDGDLDLAFFDPYGEFMDQSARATDGERIVEVANFTGEHFITIDGWLGADNVYDLTANTVCREDFSCPADDPYEPNDARAAAVRLDPLYDRAIGMTCGDDDWFYVDAQPGCTVSAWLSFTHSAGDLDLEIVDGANDVVGESSGTTNMETADTYVWVAGKIAIRVKPYGGAQNDYLVETLVDCP